MTSFNEVICLLAEVIRHTKSGEEESGGGAAAVQAAQDGAPGLLPKAVPGGSRRRRRRRGWQTMTLHSGINTKRQDCYHAALFPAGTAIDGPGRGPRLLPNRSPADFGCGTRPRDRTVLRRLLLRPSDGGGGDDVPAASPETPFVLVQRRPPLSPQTPQPQREEGEKGTC